jgi:hypothetical protein
MITPQFTMTVSDLGVRASFERLRPALMTELRKTITSLTQQLLAQVEAREPVRTGYMRSRTAAFVDVRENFIRGRVRILATGSAQRVAAAFGALEYGAKHQLVAVSAYSRRGGRVRAYDRRFHITEWRFLRGPAAAMRPQIIAELEAAVARSFGEVQR